MKYIIAFSISLFLALSTPTVTQARLARDGTKTRDLKRNSKKSSKGSTMKRRSKKGSKAASGMGLASRNLGWLEGRWNKCDLRVGRKINSVVTDDSNSWPTCTETHFLDISSLNDDKSIFEMRFEWFGQCAVFGLEGNDCPLDINGAKLVKLRKFFVASLSFNPNAQELVFISNEEQYQNKDGGWQTVYERQISDSERKTCFIGSPSDDKRGFDTLYCDSEWMLVREIARDVQDDLVYTISGSYTKDLKNCPVCV